MRIVVNDIAASSGGALTILESFYSYLRESNDANEWIFLLGSDLLEQSPRISTMVLPEIKKTWMNRLVFDAIAGRRLIASMHPHVVLSLQNTVTYGVNCPQVVYMHQSLPFQRIRRYSLWRKTERRLAVYQHLIGSVIRLSLKRADHVIVQAHWIRDAIVDQLGIPSERIAVISPDFEDVAAYRRNEPIDSRAFFYPTSEPSYKNVACIEQACQLLVKREVVDFEVTMTIESSQAPRVNAIGRITRAGVLERLSRSVLIFPSLIESYSLPLAEARALGSVVLAADLPHAREVLKGYENAYYFDPDSPWDLATLMQRVINGDIGRLPSAPNVPSAPAWARVVEIVESYGRGGGGEE